jgi:anti-sigma regulatory factor (Ser/Thr protein kinase)
MTGHPAAPAATTWPLSSALVLGALPPAAGCARLHARNVMCEWDLAEAAENAELVVSELTTNAIRATTGPDGRPRYENELSGLPVIHLRLLSDRARVLIEVWDRSAGTPSAKSPAPDEEGGRGLMLVDALCDQWSWEVVQGWSGKVVWAVLRLKPATC